MLVIATLAGTDIFYGMGTLLYGIYRSYVLGQGQQKVLITKWECVILPATIMSYIGGQLTSLMNVILSIDRLRAIAWPLKYQHLDDRYAFKVMVRIFQFSNMF